MPLKKTLTTLILLALILLPAGSLLAENWRQDFTRALKNGGAYVEDSAGAVLFEHRSTEQFMPASILKIATAACAIHVFGPDVRFATDFFLTRDSRLVVKGYGDPFLISEELAMIAQALRLKGLRDLAGILLDHSHFAPDIVIDGASSSNNPYDAINGALVVNFNTIFIVKRSSGEIQSAEPQTPLTPIARAIAKRYPPGERRVNLGKDLTKSTLYFGELLKAFLEREGIKTNGDIQVASLPQGAKHIYRYKSSKKLTDVIRGLLEFSTNFMANQLLLVMGAKEYGPPATIEKGLPVLRGCLERKIGWQNFKVYEGAGLSRKNRVTPRQMMQLLRHFEPYRNLLPVERKVFQTKTGTLTGVNTLAGFFPKDGGGFVRFVIMVNDKVPYTYKFTLAKKLYMGINGHPPP